MSWQTYVDGNLVSTGNFDRAAIFNKEGTSVWATTPGFTLKPEELQAIARHYQDITEPRKVFGTGFHIAGEKFLTLKADSRSLYGKKGKEGICICQTKLAILVAHYGESVQPGSAANTIEQLADYLIGVNY